MFSVDCSVLLVRCSGLTVACRLSLVACRVVTVACWLSLVACCGSSVICPVSSVQCPVLLVACGVIRVACRLSRGNCCVLRVACRVRDGCDGAERGSEGPLFLIAIRPFAGTTCLGLGRHGAQERRSGSLRALPRFLRGKGAERRFWRLTGHFWRGGPERPRSNRGSITARASRA